MRQAIEKQQSKVAQAMFLEMHMNNIDQMMTIETETKICLATRYVIRKAEGRWKHEK